MMGSIHIPQFPELTFDEFTHTYRLNELIIPSVENLVVDPALRRQDLRLAQLPPLPERLEVSGIGRRDVLNAKFGGRCFRP